jgi:hypothetical protein
METKIIDGYEVRTLSYADVKPLMKAQNEKTLKGDFQDELAGIAVRGPDGEPLGVEPLLALPFPLAQKLLLAVAEANTIQSDPEADPAEGNA